MTVATPILPNRGAQNGTTYTSNIDAAVKVLSEAGFQFACHEQSTPDMTVRVEAGRVRNDDTIVEVAAQNTATITAPSVNPRIDVVCINKTTGVVSVVTGAEAASPTVPVIGDAVFPVCTVLLQTSTTSIVNTIITDARNIFDNTEISTFIRTFLNAADADAAREILAASSKLPQWTSAQLVGSALTITGIVTAVSARLNATDIAVTDFGTEELRTYRFDGAAWSLVGSGLSVTGIGSRALAALNSTDVAYIDSANDELRTYRFNGSTWSLVGSGLSITGVGAPPALTALNSTDVAFIDFSNKELRTYRFNGSTWSQVGSGLTITGATECAITALSSTEIAFLSANNYTLKTYNFNGSSWSEHIGSSLVVSGAGWPTMTALNGNDVAFFASTTQKLETYRFNGTVWAKVGGYLTLDLSTNPHITALNGTDIAALNSGADTLATYRLGFYIGDGPYFP